MPIVTGDFHPDSPPWMTAAVTRPMAITAVT